LIQRFGCVQNQIAALGAPAQSDLIGDRGGPWLYANRPLLRLFRCVLAYKSDRVPGAKNLPNGSLSDHAVAARNQHFHRRYLR
jgi:hypothetical protein